MATPAQRYASARRRASAFGPRLRAFVEGYSFPLDDFQVSACQALEAGRGVLVAAPTGSGKTVVGEFAVALALSGNGKCFYTTPIKALSNQKYHDLVAIHGSDRVGLLTGDTTVNGEAPIVVMTTEVLRNMLYSGSGTLGGLAYVVMDEVHYLADRFRGAVWEEVIIHLAESVTVVALSATVSNAEEFGEWLATVRGDTEVVVSEHRPVPLWQQVIVGRKLFDLFADDDHGGVNPELQRLARDEERLFRLRGHRTPRGQRRGRPPGVPSRPDVVAALESRGLLPAITFVFSRAGCDAAVRQLLNANVRLSDPATRETVRRLAEERTGHLGDDDLRVLGYDEWLAGLERGYAAHHAGLLPVFKEVVEELFSANLVQLVFATETLALGINMPARTVVIEKLSKWNGETHADITPAEYTQLTGRAGRRGIDVEGDAVVLWQPGFDPQALAGLASTRTYQLRSSFRPTYNMAVNLVRQMGRHTSREVLETSFAQFQADRAVVGLAKQARKQEEALAGYREAMACDAGDFDAYLQIRRAMSDREKALSRQRGASRQAEVAQAMAALRPGDVIRLPGGGRRGTRLGVVVDAGGRGGVDSPRPTVVTDDKQVRRFAGSDFARPPTPLTRFRLAKDLQPRSPQTRRELAARLKELDAGPAQRDGSAGTSGPDHEVAELRRQLRAHPCHACPEREDHARWGERLLRLQKETDGLQRRMDNRTQSIARVFDRVVAVLAELDYLDGDTVTPAGLRLGRLYTELDLLTAECLRAGVWRGLGPAELASATSLLIYEARRDDHVSPKLPGGAARDAIEAMHDLADDLDAVERRHRLEGRRVPDAGFAFAAFRWASGHRLEAILHENDLAAGDFVRWCKQLVDLLGQVASASADDPELQASARAAVAAVRRGIVSVDVTP